MSAYSDALAQLAILHTAQSASALPADMDTAIRALQASVGQMLAADQAAITSNSAYQDLLKQAGYLEDMSQTANYDQGQVTTDADLLTTVVDGMIAHDAAAATAGVNKLPPVNVTITQPSPTATVALAAVGGLLVGALLIGLARKAGL